MGVTVDQAVAALEAYGYKKVGERYVKAGRSTQQWMPQGDGFLRFDDPGGVPVPHSRNEEGNTSIPINIEGGVDPRFNDEFNWTWPASEVFSIYSHAAEQAAAGWPDLRTDEDRAVDAAGGRAAQEAAAEG